MGVHHGRWFGTEFPARNDGDVAQAHALFANLVGVVAGIHQIVKTGHALRRQQRQRHGRLRIVERGRGQHATDGICPSATSICNLKPIQKDLLPLLLVLQPTSQARGKSANICSNVIVPEHCRSSLVICSGLFAFFDFLWWDRRGGGAAAGP